MKARLTLAILLLSVAAATAQRTPKPGPEMEKLSFLMGQWTFTDKYERAGQGTGTVRAHPGPGGFSILLDSHTEGSQGEVVALQVIFWDAKAAAYTLYWLDNATAGSFVAAGNWEGQELVFTSEANGTLFRTVYRDIAADSHTIALYKRRPGKALELSMTTRMKRK